MTCTDMCADKHTQINILHLKWVNKYEGHRVKCPEEQVCTDVCRPTFNKLTAEAAPRSLASKLMFNSSKRMNSVCYLVFLPWISYGGGSGLNMFISLNNWSWTGGAVLEGWEIFRRWSLTRESKSLEKMLAVIARGHFLSSLDFLTVGAMPSLPWKTVSLL